MNKHDEAVSGMNSAIDGAAQTERGRLLAAISFLQGGLSAMAADGSTTEDFVEALDHFHQERHKLVRKIKGGK